ncbi:MAG: rod shape-determining protein RodA [Deltaproteobacteria bacterium]|nr:rod shape-determining protein RodA [Deltaproteobacteria bacterium]
MSLGGAGGPGAPRRLVANAPWGVALLVLGISALGVWNLASASRSAHAPVWIAQLWWMGAGSVVAAAVVMFDDRTFHRLAWVFYFAVVALLVLVLLKGRWVMGARRWLTFGPVNFQPSELAKIAVAMALARWFHEDAARRPGPYGLLRLAVPIGITALPALLIKRQPDLGTALVVVAVGATVILFAGVRWKALAALGLAALVGAVLVWPHLQPYQRKRVETFLNPEGDVRGAGYHATQSIIAVGSGQGTGKGWGQGTQSLLSFLPEQHTDFIFSVWAEEHGFLGCLFLLALYLALVLAALGIAGNARDRFGHLLAVGITGMLFWQAAINVAMVIGLLPVVGVTLPLMSYGGSSVLTVFFGLGLLANVAVRRFVN